MGAVASNIARSWQSIRITANRNSNRVKYSAELGLCASANIVPIAILDTSELLLPDF